ncbi:MAG: carboxyl-terminal protease [Verrucomicrobiales bacterium]|nr:carboxyl-terminal protease [Verrucomicrobiales bacterium]MDB6130646.1 carboxyl-terminal protease [Verrucomicrobiales bacterium]
MVMKTITTLAALLLGSLGLCQGAAEPRFDEVYKLLEKNLISVTNLEQSAVKGLLGQLKMEAMLVTNTTEKATKISIEKSAVYDGSFAYMHVSEVGSGLAETLVSALHAIESTNKVKGLVLDLRFSSGTDYSAAGSIADQFLQSGDMPLLDWGNGMMKSKSKKDALDLPLVVLVNHETTGAAEALAGILRETKAGLLIGSNTSGKASIYKDFTLSTGQKLRIANTPVKISNGNPISREGLKPDITVISTLEEEKGFLEDPYRTLYQPGSTPLITGSDTNNISSRTNKAKGRLNEAELVRMQREGLNSEVEAAGRSLRDSETKAVITDPALSRALDLLKGIAVVQRSRTS